MYCICNPTCMYCLVHKGQTSVKSNKVFKKHYLATHKFLVQQQLWRCKAKLYWFYLCTNHPVNQSHTKKAFNIYKTFANFYWQLFFYSEQKFICLNQSKSKVHLLKLVLSRLCFSKNNIFKNVLQFPKQCCNARQASFWNP